jgi:hypothetical protein
MGTTYYRSDNTASATTEHHLRMSSLCAKNPDNQHSGEPICEEQDLAAMFEPEEVHEWLPLPLRPSYLEFLSCVSLLLSGVVFYLTIRSSEHHGICDNNKSAATFFSWRFLPTLVATVYSLLVATLVNDVRRTEIFARLSDPEGAPQRTPCACPRGRGGTILSMPGAKKRTTESAVGLCCPLRWPISWLSS